MIPTTPRRWVERIRALGRIPLREFTPEDYRLIITQRRALPTLLPRAIELLEVDPFAEGDLYAGDLLVTVAQIPPQAWGAYKELYARLERVVRAAIARMDELDEDDREALEPKLRTVYEQF